MTTTLRLYRQCSRLPLGKFLFMRGLEFKAPYFRSLRAVPMEYREGYTRFIVRGRRRVHNHIGSVHAIARCNLAEMCGALAVDSVVPPHLRWIAQGMTVKYTAKAHGDITGVCELPSTETQPGVIAAPVTMRDPAGNVVMTATIDFYVSAKK